MTVDYGHQPPKLAVNPVVGSSNLSRGAIKSITYKKKLDPSIVSRRTSHFMADYLKKARFCRSRTPSKGDSRCGTSVRRSGDPTPAINSIEFQPIFTSADGSERIARSRLRILPLALRGSGIRPIVKRSGTL